MTDGPTILTAPYYERLEDLERRHWWCRSVRRVAISFLEELDPGSRVLDLGCGAGGFLAARPARPGVGLDPSFDALSHARRKGLRLLVAGSASPLPFASASFHAVVSHDDLQHLPQGVDAAALHEARRVLVPGGLLSIRSNLGPRVEIAGESLHRRYDVPALAALVTGAGFTIEKHLVLHPLAALVGRLRRPRHGHGPGHGHRHAGTHGLTLVVPPAPVNAAMDLYARVEDAVLSALPVRAPLGDTQLVFARR